MHGRLGKGGGRGSCWSLCKCASALIGMICRQATKIDMMVGRKMSGNDRSLEDGRPTSAADVAQTLSKTVQKRERLKLNQTTASGAEQMSCRLQREI